MVVPPKLVRRVVIAPLVLLVELSIVVLSPLAALVAAFASPLTGGAWRPLRAVGITVAFLARHLATMLGCLALWVAAGFGLRAGSARMQDAHHALLRWFVSGVNRQITSLARVDLHAGESQAADDVLSSNGRPVIVLSRHAGEGDSLLVLHELLCRYRRRARIVLHEGLQLDPVLDVLGHRLGWRFVDPRGGDTEVEIAAMARGLPGEGAVLIFPEGGNFSEERRRRGIERLESRGFAEEAEWARSMENVSAPRPGGALAAIEAAPGADIVFVAHDGMPDGFGELWRMLLGRTRVELRMWAVQADDVPEDHDEQIDWLFGEWCTLDRWLAERDGGPQSDAPRDDRHRPAAAR
jgi:1-acyl-sn-glycerol-3-phosphate acyltransferase